MNAKEQIKRDLTNYANSKNLDIKVAIENILSVAPTATLEEYHEYPDVIKAWLVLQVIDQTYLAYYSSESLGEFIYDTRMFQVGYNCLRYKPSCKYPVYIPDGCISTYDMFAGMKLPEDFSFAEDFDTSAITNMRAMFHKCKFPAKFMLPSKFDTGNVTNMSYMFADCKMPEGFTLGDKFDTSNVTNMQGMFAFCEMPNSFTLGDKFDTSKVTDMRDMFTECEFPEGFTLGNKFNTSNVTDMAAMFEDCVMPDGFTLGDKFNTQSVIDMSFMFSGCTMSDGFTLGENFITKNITNFDYMFYLSDFYYKHRDMLAVELIQKYRHEKWRKDSESR